VADTPELTDEEVSVLCDIEKDGSTKSHKQSVVQSLIERGFVVSSQEPRGSSLPFTLSSF
jgi:hypothetical protein